MNEKKRLWSHPLSPYAKFSEKTNIYNSLIRTRTCAYPGVRDVSFSENFAYVLNGWPLFIFFCELKFEAPKHGALLLTSTLINTSR